MRVNVFIWFDVEDYITPESDLALGRLIETFDRHNLKATFKMVGEKVRGLVRRNHGEILRALWSHDIGYHTDYHSRPPSISEYMLDYDWESGIAAFREREQAGLDTLRAAFNRTPSCYGQPGGAWAPQVYPALRQWGIPVYLDAGPWVALDGRPHWYCGVLDMLGLEGVMSIGISRGREGVLRSQAAVTDVVERMRATGGVVSLYAHECEFVTAQFWDGLNYARGADTPRPEWRPVPIVSEAEQEARYAALDELLSRLQAMPDVHVVTAAEAPSLYRDRAKGRAFSPEQVCGMAAGMVEGITHQECDGAWLSPAEVYALTVRLLADRVRNGRWPEQVAYRYVDGPTEHPNTSLTSSALSLDNVYGTCLYEDAFLDTCRHMPAQVQVGRDWLAPADFMATIGGMIERWFGGSDNDAPILASDFAQAKHIPEHVPWEWTIFPPGFNADPLLHLGRLQAWTLKPAECLD